MDVIAHLMHCQSPALCKQSIGAVIVLQWPPPVRFPLSRHRRIEFQVAASLQNDRPVFILGKKTQRVLTTLLRALPRALCRKASVKFLERPIAVNYYRKRLSLQSKITVENKSISNKTLCNVAILNFSRLRFTIIYYIYYYTVLYIIYTIIYYSVLYDDNFCNRDFQR